MEYWNKIILYKNNVRTTAHNKRYTLRRHSAARATFLLGQSLPSVARSHAKTPPHCQPLG